MSAASATPLPSAIDLLCKAPYIWRGRDLARQPGLSTGFPALDAQLPGAGWPIGALTEVAPACAGIGELTVTIPALRALCEQGRQICFVQPPHPPYAPALVASGLPLSQVVWVTTNDDADARWAAQELLREASAGAVLLWSSTHDDRALRRLQLAAESGRSLAFLHRRPEDLRRASPAALRIEMMPADEDVEVRIVKVRGGHPASIRLGLPWISA